MSGQAVTMQGTGDSWWARLDGRDNALNAIRLALATLVLIAHTYPIGYGTPAPIEHIAGYAVDGFFVISGYLIASSRNRLPLSVFLWRRALRIYPGLWVCLAVTGLLVAPAAAGATLLDGVRYIAANLVVPSGTSGIGSTLTTVPVAGQWNGSIWTLTYELGCYVGLGLAWSAGRHRGAVIGGCFVACTLLLALRPSVVTDVFAVQHAVRLAAFFAAGALLWMCRKWVPATPRLAALSAAVVATSATAGLPFYWTAAPLPLAYLLLWTGSRMTVRAGVKNDISFGVYLYAFPLQQTLTLLGVSRSVPPVVFAALALACVVPFAWASWLWVERPVSQHAKRRAPSPTKRPHLLSATRRRTTSTRQHPHRLGPTSTPHAVTACHLDRPPTPRGVATTAGGRRH